MGILDKGDFLTPLIGIMFLQGRGLIGFMGISRCSGDKDIENRIKSYQQVYNSLVKK